MCGNAGTNNSNSGRIFSGVATATVSADDILADAFVGHRFHTFGHQFGRPRVAVRISESHGDIAQGFDVALQQILYLADAFQGSGHVRIRCCAAKTWAIPSADTPRNGCRKLCRAPGAVQVTDDRQQLGGGLHPFHRGGHQIRIGHLGHGFGRNKTAKVQYVKPYLKQGTDVADFLVGGNKVRQSLHRIARTFGNV